MKKIFDKFDIKEKFISAELYGNGNINETFLVKADAQDKINRYILQKINHHVFKDIDGLMKNTEFITSYLENISPDFKTQRIVKTKDNKNYYFDEENYIYWRVFTYIKDSVTVEKIDAPEQFYQTGIAFGFFQKQLKKFNANLLVETIPHFHNTKKRYEDFLKQVKLDLSERAHLAQDEIDFINSRKDYANVLVDLIEKGKIPLRVTHNDTKLNNILFHKETGRVLSVIDLDTIMPGSILYDFGDAIRYGANKANEDEKDLSKIGLDLHLFEVFTRGFLKYTANMMNKEEIEHLAFSVLLITYELAMRFLGDYLDGDIYFKTDHEDHNLQRARAQIALVKDIENKLTEMEKIVKKIKNKCLNSSS